MLCACWEPFSNLFLLSYSAYFDIPLLIFILARYEPTMLLFFFLSLSFNYSHEGGSNDTMCSCYFVSLQGETYILLYYLSRLNNSPIFKLEKGKPIALAEKSNSDVHLPVNQILTCAEAVDQHQQLDGRLKHFSSFGTNPLRQSGEKQAQRESKYYDRFISEEKIFTDMIRNDSMLRDAILYFIKLSKELC